MKLIKTLFLTLIFSTFCFAQVDIDAQIQEIKNAPAQERVKLMNKLKAQLTQMNAEDREEAILKLRSQNRIQNQVQSNQADNIQQMRNVDKINQKQVNGIEANLKQSKH